MIQLIRAIFARIKAILATDAMLEMEADVALRGAERKAALMRMAAQYEQEGLPTVARELRQQAEALDVEKSLSSVPAINEPGKPVLPTAPISINGATTSPPQRLVDSSKQASRARRSGK